MTPRAWYWIAVSAIVAITAYTFGHTDGEASANETASRVAATHALAMRDTIKRLESAVRTDTVRLTVTRVKSDDRIARSTVTVPTGQDSSGALVFTPVVPLDTVTAVMKEDRAACDSLVAHLTQQVRWLQRLDTLTTQQGRVARFGRMRFRDRFGVSLGYGALLSNDGIVRVGPVVSVGIKVWP